MNKALIYVELSAEEKEQALQAFKVAHAHIGGVFEPQFAPDRAWVEGYAYALAALRSMPAEPVAKVELFTNDHMKKLYEAAKADPRTKSMGDEGWFVMGCAMAEYHIRSFSSPFTLPPAPVLSDAEIDAITVAQWGDRAVTAAHRAYARAIEQAIGRASRGAK